MTELVYLKNDEAVCSSLQVAEKFGNGVSGQCFRNGGIKQYIANIGF